MTAAQAAAVGETVGSMLGYLSRLKGGLERNGYARTETHLRVVEAWEKVYGLSVFLHYESCRHGVGMPPRDDE